MTDRWTGRLSEYLDGDLPAAERHEIEAHVAHCDGCATVLAGLRAVVGEARTLAHTPPAEDLWPAISARIRAPGAASAGARNTSSMEAPFSAQPAAIRRGLLDWLGRSVTLTVPQAVMAAAALLVVAGASMWLAFGRGPLSTRPGPADPGMTSGLASRGTAASPTGTAGTTSTGLSASTAVATSDARYDATIAELQRILEQDRGRLDPNTVRVLEKNLAIIDRAMADARDAVEADPANIYLRNHLASVMKRKAEILRQATLIAGAQG